MNSEYCSRTVLFVRRLFGFGSLVTLRFTTTPQSTCNFITDRPLFVKLDYSLSRNQQKSTKMTSSKSKSNRIMYATNSITNSYITITIRTVKTEEKSSSKNIETRKTDKNQTLLHEMCMEIMWFSSRARRIIQKH